MPGTKDALAGG